MAKVTKVDRTKSIIARGKSQGKTSRAIIGELRRRVFGGVDATARSYYYAHHNDVETNNS